MRAGRSYKLRVNDSLRCSVHRRSREISSVNHHVTVYRWLRRIVTGSFESITYLGCPCALNRFTHTHTHTHAHAQTNTNTPYLCHLPLLIEPLYRLHADQVRPPPLRPSARHPQVNYFRVRPRRPCVARMRGASRSEAVWMAAQKPAGSASKMLASACSA
jgi:hypothetical protein